MATDTEKSPEQQIATWFARAGYEVTEVVGKEAPRVERFARPRQGLVRPRIYWTVWQSWPKQIVDALKELLAHASELGADRAWAVVFEDEPPVDYVTDLELPSTAFTLRRFALELSGVVQQARSSVSRYRLSKENEIYAERRGKTASGEIVDPTVFIADWAAGDVRGDLALIGPPGSGISTTMGHAVYRINQRFLADPNHQTPVVRSLGVVDEVFQRGWAVPLLDDTDRIESLGPRAGLWEIHEAALRGSENETRRTRLEKADVLQLLPVADDALENTYRASLSVKQYESYVTAKKFSDFATLATDVKTLRALVSAIREVEPATGPSSQWLARVIVALVERTKVPPDQTQRLKQGALEQFALGNAPSLGEINRTSSRFLRAREVRDLREWRGWIVASIHDGAPRYSFHNRLLRDYFIALKIIDEVRAGSTSLLARYQFPEEFVLLFLAILAPEVAARTTADRTAALRAEIENEVERDVELTVAHALRRSAGAVRSHLKTIRKHLTSEQAKTLARELDRIDEESSFQSALAEQTRRFHEVPEAPLEDLSLHAALGPVAEHLRNEFFGVTFVEDVDASLFVRANVDSLREILHCLLENAFHAVACPLADDGQVRVAARVEGDTIRLDVIDNGPGVPAQDRERIFQPRVTTKKGGGQPQGTGMGLAIARRYAKHIGARVGLDVDRPNTCFYVQFVAART